MNEYLEKELNSQMNEIIRPFDYSRMFKTMRALAWTWKFASTPPDKWEVQTVMKELYNSCVKQLAEGKERVSSSSGGLTLEVEVPKESRKCSMKLYFTAEVKLVRSSY